MQARVRAGLANGRGRICGDIVTKRPLNAASCAHVLGYGCDGVFDHVGNRSDAGERIDEAPRAGKSFSFDSARIGREGHDEAWIVFLRVRS